MNKNHLIVDGMLSGTGIRNGDQGGYLSPEELGVSPELESRISDWVQRYEAAHFLQFQDRSENRALDVEGLEIARALKAELPNCKVTYFSNAELKEIPVGLV
jgi:hypothetical protein